MQPAEPHQKVHLDVGGTIFVTTLGTLEACPALRRYHERLSSDCHLFLDRDPIVFAKVLKLLRGYPVDESELNDDDLLCELVHWDHVMLLHPLPDWFKVQPLTVHTLDPVQSQAYGQTHFLLTLKTIENLVRLKCLPHDAYPNCDVVGATQGWVDCAWVPKYQVTAAKVRYQFLTHFIELPRSLKK